MQATLNNITLKIIQADLTLLKTDAIVCSVLPDLELHTTGLGRSILTAGGDGIQQALSRTAYVEEGEALITSGGSLPVKHIIHAVCPRMGTGSERGKLASAVWNSLKLAVEKNLTSIAFPALATGRSGGFPIEACARVMSQKIVDFTFEEVGHLREIVVCLLTPEILDIFQEAFNSEIEAARNEAKPS